MFDSRLTVPPSHPSQERDENFGIAHNYCMYHTRHHTFPDTDPYKVDDALDALRERLGIHAQLDKQQALDMLVARFRRAEWRTDTPDVHARIISLLLELSRNPLQTKYTHIDAMAALGEDDMGAVDATSDEEDDKRDTDPTSSSPMDEDVDAGSDSTLSDWTDDEEEEARAEALRLDVEAAVAERRRDGRTRTEDADDDFASPIDGSTHADAAPSLDPEFRWSDLKVDDTPASTSYEAASDAWEWDPRARGIRGGAGDTVAAAAARLLPALAAARSREGAHLVETWDGSTESKVVGAAMHALVGAAPASRAPGVAVPHLSPAALSAGLERAADAAATLDLVERAAGAVLATPAPVAAYVAGYEQLAGGGGAGPTVRAFAAALTGHVRELRETLAPLLQRAAGLGVGDVAGAPTLLELRAAVRSVAARARVLDSLAAVALPPRLATGLAGEGGDSPASNAARCLTALHRAAAAHQTTSCASGIGASDGGDGFVASLRLLCSASQPYLAATHRWLESGELHDPAGELFVRAGPEHGVNAVGTEAHWEGGFVLRRGGVDGGVLVPEFLRLHVEELLAAGKSVRLLRRGGGGGARVDDDTDGTRPGSRRESGPTKAPKMHSHLCVDFCDAIRRALETSTPGNKGGDDKENAAKVANNATTDESVRLLSGATLTPCPPPKGPEDDGMPGFIVGAGMARKAAEAEARLLVSAGVAGSTTTLDAFVGDAAEWGGTPFTRPRSIAAAAHLDAWLRTSPEARSPATCPAAALIARAAVEPARARASVVNRALMSRLRGDWRLGAHLASLRAVFLGGTGEAAHSFAASVFERLDSAGQKSRGGGQSSPEDESDGIGLADPSELTAALADAFAADGSGDLPNPRDVSIDVLPTPLNPTAQMGAVGNRRRSVWGGSGDGEFGGEGAARLEALGRLRLSVKTPWPLTLVVPESCADRYNACATFLLQLRRARAAVEEASRAGWSPEARRAPSWCGGGFHAQALLTELRHFTQALHEHVIGRVLHHAWLELERDVARATSPAEARAAHEKFLDASCRQCLASPDPTWTLLAGQVRAALGIACDFAAAQRRAGNDARDAVKDVDVGPGFVVDGVTAAFAASAAGYEPVSEKEAERLAGAFRRARSYVLRVIESKLRVGTYPELHELRLRLNFNEFYGGEEQQASE